MTQAGMKAMAWDWRGALGLRDRARRVTILVWGIMALSIADLVVTLAFLHAHWMIEANPIAAWLIRYTQSPWTLAAFKLASVGICVALLHRVRHHRVGEIAAWCAVAILTVMSVMWHNYSRHFEEPNDLSVAQAPQPGDMRLGLP